MRLLRKKSFSNSTFSHIHSLDAFDLSLWHTIGSSMFQNGTNCDRPGTGSCFTPDLCPFQDIRFYPVFIYYAKIQAIFQYILFFFKKVPMFQCSNVPEHFRCRCGGEGESLNEKTKTIFHFVNFQFSIVHVCSIEYSFIIYIIYKI